MKKQTIKLFSAILMLGLTLLNLSIDSNGFLSLQSSKAASQNTTEPKKVWHEVQVECQHDDSGETVSMHTDCVAGTEEICTPTTCAAIPDTKPTP
jgi:hypothetical protein